jgi:hypothetical protein
MLTMAQARAAMHCAATDADVMVSSRQIGVCTRAARAA